MSTNAINAINHPPLAPQNSPPTVMGVYYREYTLFPLQRKFGRNIVLYNRTMGHIAQVDTRGCVRLEPGGEYLPERLDSDRLKKLLEDARRTAKQLSSSSSKWSTRISGSLSNLTIGRGHRRSTSPPSKTSSKYTPPSTSSSEHAPPFPVFASLDLGSSQRDQLSIPEDGGFLGTIRAKRRSSEQHSLASRSRSSSQDKRNTLCDTRSPVSADTLPRGQSSCSTVEFAVMDDDESGDGKELSLEEFVKGANRFKSSPNVSFIMDNSLINATTTDSNGQLNSSAPGNRNSVHGCSISEEEHPDTSNTCSSTALAEMVDVAMFSSLIILIDGRPGTVWVNLQAGHIHIYSDPHLYGLVDTVAVADNCLAVPDTRPGADPCLFHILQDDSCFALVTKTKEEMLNWVSTINTASLAHIVAPLLPGSPKSASNQDPTVSGDHTCDYRKEYEEIVKSFDLVELTRIKLPAASTQTIVSISQDTNASECATPRPNARNLSDRLHELRKDHRMSVLRQTTMTEVTGSDPGVTPDGATHLQCLSITIPSGYGGTSEISRLGSIGDTWSSTVGSSLIPPMRSPPASPTTQQESVDKESPILSGIPIPGSDSPPKPSGSLSRQATMNSSQTSLRGPADYMEPSSKPTLFGANGAGAPLLRRNTNESASSPALMDIGTSVTSTSICAASLDKLIERLACDLSYDANYVDTFLIGYRHIAPASAVLDKLFARMYCMAPSGATPEEHMFVLTWRPIVRLRAVAVIKHWVDRYWVDFLLDPAARDKLDEILWAMDKFEPEGDEVGVVALEQRAFLARLAKLIRKLIILQNSKSTRVAPGPAAVSPASPSKNNPPCEFLDIDPVHIAVQLTVLEFKRFKAVRPIDCVLNLWGDTKDPAVQLELDAITEMVNSFNQVSYWVATEICTQPELPNRIKVLERMIKIAKVCKHERNYNTLVSIIAGLNNSAVQRLKQTWEGVQDKYMQSFADLEALVSQNHNFKNYRHVLDTMEHESWRYAFVPFFGLFLKDLMFWNENPKLADSGLINFSKLRSIASLIQDLQKWQAHEYVPLTSIQYDPTTSSPTSTPSPGKTVHTGGRTVHGIPDLVETYCKHLRALKEQNIYKYSCLCEKKLGGVAATAAPGAESIRLIDKWASEKSPDNRSSGKAR